MDSLVPTTDLGTCQVLRCSEAATTLARVGLPSLAMWRVDGTAIAIACEDIMLRLCPTHTRVLAAHVLAPQIVASDDHNRYSKKERPAWWTRD